MSGVHVDAGAGVGLADRLREVAAVWAQSQFEIVVLAAEFADSNEWIGSGSPTAAHWLAAVADVEVCTAREWVRIGRQLAALPASADAFAAGEISYSKVRALTRFATPDNEAELLVIARAVPAGKLNVALAAWLHRVSTPDEIEERHHRQRSLRWRTEPDAMVTFTARVAPLLAGILMSALTQIVMRSKPRNASAGAWPTAAAQYADAFEQLLTAGVGPVTTEIVVHVRGDGATLDDGTPIAGSVVERIAPTSFLRALIHDAERRPVGASHRRRHPTARQRRVVKERDRVCVDCGRDELIQFDHVPDYETSHHTAVDELVLRCAPCHQARHHAHG